MSLKIFPTENFAKLRQNGGYYVDKTGFLEQFLNAYPDVALFTRPRRFGKSLFMSMLAEFFDIKKQGSGQNLFEGLAVYENEKLCHEWMHQHPVISISLKDIDPTSFANTLNSIQRLVGDICINNIELLNSSAVDSEDRRELKLLHSKKAGTDTIADALFILTRAMCTHYGKPAIVLIDEYDVPVAKAAENNYYAEMIKFMRLFLSRALKGNPHLSFAILTGALRVTKESLFTGLNNLECFDISASSYSDVFGFTQDEVDELLAKAGCREKREIVKKWYDGYNFGKRQDIYCPLSIMKYVRELQSHPDEEPQAWWVNTSRNALALDFVSRLPDEAKVHENFAILLGGDPIAVTLNPCMSYVDIFADEDNFWTLLYLTGYLTMAGDPDLFQVDTNSEQSLLAIPNREVRKVFQRELKVLLKGILPKNLRSALTDALWEKNQAELEKLLTVMLEGCSVHDAKEAWYHGMMYGILLPRNESIDSNGESGHGRYDLYVPDKENSRAMILEFKRVSDKARLEAGVRDALKQIEEKNYDQRARKEGYKRILRVGIAFCGKSVKVGFDEVL